jgi:holo-[acyl-carrier protein] synthase
VILGHGVDVVSISAFAELLADEASRFADATFTEAERVYAASASSKHPAQHLAARYAAKEATLKAFDAAGGDMPVRTIELSSIEVVRDARGRPTLTLHAEALALATELGGTRTHLSLSHDGDLAIASVILER